MGSTFRTDPDMSDANEPATILDRAWAATRPADLSPAEADRLWGGVLQALDQPSTLTMDSPTTSRSRRFTAVALVTFALAQAAAIVLAVLMTVRPDPKHPIQLAQVDPTPAKVTNPSPTRVLTFTLDVEPDEEVMVSIDAQGSVIDEKRNKPSDPGSTLAYGNVLANNGNDVLNSLEPKSQ
jgi:hypothetical protein